MGAFFQAGNCFVPYSNVRYVIDRGAVIIVHLYSRNGPEEQYEVIIVEGDDLEPFRTWLIESSDGPRQENFEGALGFQQGSEVVRV